MEGTSVRRFVTVAALATLLGAACGTPAQEQSATTADAPPGSPVAPASSSTAAPASTTTAVPAPAWAPAPEWAEPAVVYLDAYRAALAGGDVEEVFPFLAETVHWYGGEPGGRLRTGLLDTLNGLVRADPTERLPGLLFVEWVYAGTGIAYDIDWVHEAVLPAGACPGDDPCRRVQDLHLTVGPEGVMQHRVVPHVADVPADSAAEQADVEQIESRYAEIAERLSSGNAEYAAAMMSDNPVWEDTGDGLERVNPRELWTELLGYIFAAVPESTVSTLTTADLGLPGEPRPAVFFTPSDSLLRFREPTIGGVGIFRQRVGQDESILVAFEWFEGTDGIVDLDLEVEPAGLGLPSAGGDAAPMVDDPSLWPQVPGPTRRITGTIDAGRESIQVYNGSDSQQALVEWALGRYEAAGLPVPIPRAVAFPPSVNCVLHAGLAIDTGDGVDIQLCFDEAETCLGEACLPSADARSTLLHELGHVWTVQNLDDATRSAFVDFRGLEVWSAPGVNRDDLGTEHAAEILAWALLEDDTWPARLPDNECSRLAGAFRVLTGVDPPRACPEG